VERNGSWGRGREVTFLVKGRRLGGRNGRRRSILRIGRRGRILVAVMWVVDAVNDGEKRGAGGKL
jgi:hypothetical protein